MITSQACNEKMERAFPDDDEFVQVMGYVKSRIIQCIFELTASLPEKEFMNMLRQECIANGGMLQ